MKEKNNQNFYKYTTFALLAVIIIAGIVYLIGMYNDSVYTRGVIDGQSNAVNVLLTSIINTGSAEIGIDANTSVILVPLQTVQAAQTEVLTTVAQTAVTNGFVSLTIEDQTLVLVPVDPAQLEAAQGSN